MGDTSPVTSQLERKRIVRFFFPLESRCRRSITVLSVCMARAVKSLRGCIGFDAWPRGPPSGRPFVRVCIYVRVVYTCIRVCVCVNLCAETNFSSDENNIVQGRGKSLELGQLQRRRGGGRKNKSITEGKRKIVTIRVGTYNISGEEKLKLFPLHTRI